MKSIILSLILFLSMAGTVQAQKFITKNGYIRFYSHAPAEDIEANNHSVNAALDLASGDFVFKVLMKSFVFEKALMQEHFNENYVESDKFPVATFVGKIGNISDIDFSKDGEYEVTVKGKLTIHGVTHEVEQEGVLKIESGKILATSKFLIAVADYDIIIPKAVRNNIAKEVEVSVSVNLLKL